MSCATRKIRSKACTAKQCRAASPWPATTRNCKPGCRPTPARALPTWTPANIIRITDLPSEAQQKLFDRKGFRDRFRRNALAWFAEPARAGDEQPSLRPGIDTL